MHRFKNILVVAEEGEHGRATLARAVRLARRNEARLTVVDPLRRTTAERALPRNLQNAIVSERRSLLKQLTEPFREQDVQIHEKLLYGTPFIEVIREVLRSSHDLVIIAAKSAVGLRARVFGSFSLHLMRKCPCPVWVLGPAPRYPTGQILAAVDPSPTDAENDSVNAQIIELATSIARLTKGHLHIVHAWELWGEDLMRRRTRNLGAADWAVHEERIAAQTRLNEFLGHYILDDVHYHVHLVKGKASRVIASLVAKHAIDLVVVGTVCRTGIAGMLIGSTAENMLGQMDCSVLALKPRGFVSPVEVTNPRGATSIEPASCGGHSGNFPHQTDRDRYPSRPVSRDRPVRPTGSNGTPGLGIHCR